MHFVLLIFVPFIPCWEISPMQLLPLNWGPVHRLRMRTRALYSPTHPRHPVHLPWHTEPSCIPIQPSHSLRNHCGVSRKFLLERQTWFAVTKFSRCNYTRITAKLYNKKDENHELSYCTLVEVTFS